MPIYEYECTECGNQVEAWQKFSDLPLDECELCHGRLKKIISQNNFHLKGSGWYVTDYASKASRASGTGMKDSGKKDNKSSKTETKPGSGASTKKDTSSSTKTKE
ncbi:MAG: FmdB family zinc ribbon protein [Thermodesulfobacteriota bacterium]|nr:FmdB family zinc ribbon protein [Thermodesulfobacteriota bacterium]